MQTLILRHRRENLKKCSLRGLESRSDIQFFTYPSDPLPSLKNYLLLAIDAPMLSQEDRELGILLIDGTWNHAAKMISSLPKNIPSRSLPPNLITAYPRKQTGCIDPHRGLASIEALFAAYCILGKNLEGLLEGYYWKDLFIQKNRDILSKFMS